MREDEMGLRGREGVKGEGTDVRGDGGEGGAGRGEPGESQ